MPTSSWPGADVDRDVAGAQEEELDVVVRVLHDELPGRVGPLAVAGLAEHLARAGSASDPLLGTATRSTCCS